MISVDSTVGGDQANSYVSVDYARTYLSGHMFGSTWIDSSNKQGMSLIHATSMLDLLCLWDGSVSTDTQSLLWPRLLPDGLYKDELPAQLMKATCELALHLVSKGDPAVDDSLSKLNVGPIKLEFNSDRDVTLLPDIVVAMVSDIGRVKQAQGESASNIGLLRA